MSKKAYKCIAKGFSGRGYVLAENAGKARYRVVLHLRDSGFAKHTTKKTVAGLNILMCTLYTFSDVTISRAPEYDNHPLPNGRVIDSQYVDMYKPRGGSDD